MFRAQQLSRIFSPARTLATMSAKPELHLGNMTFDWAQASAKVDDAVATKMMDHFTAAGGVNFDTARIYAGGKSEEMAGRVMAASSSHSKYQIATKASPSQENGLTPAGIRGQVAKSLAALQTDKISVLYLHQPDKTSAVADSLVTLDELVKEGTIETIGLSNFSAVEVTRIMEICKAKGLTAPTVFQGLYNPINRRVQDELFPTLKEHGMSFVAYNPLAAGMLTGKHVKDQEVAAGRFKDNKNYLDRFYKPDTFAGLELIKAACDKHKITMTQATFSWMLCHSGMAAPDGLLLGASKIEHLDQNIACCTAAAPLHNDVLEAFDGAWALTKADAFAYWRSYSADHPGREGLDQGGEYAVKK